MLQCKYYVTQVANEVIEMNEYAKFIGKALHQNVEISEFNNRRILPLFLINGYNYLVLTIQETQCLLVQPKEQTNLTSIRKQILHLKKLTGYTCALCLDNIGTYTKRKLLSEGIPFVILNKQIYMPFLGLALSNNDDRDIPVFEQISFSTQKLLLVAIYERWSKTTLTEAAFKLNVSKMTITRCFDELYSTDLDLIKTIGKTRCFVWDGSQRSLWEAVRTILRNPIIREYRLGEVVDIGKASLSGMSAVCHYSMLGDNNYETIAISKDKEKKYDIIKQPKLPNAEMPEMVIQILGYDLYSDGDIAIDPLSAILTLSNEDLNDPRVEIAVEEILKEHLND